VTLRVGMFNVLLLSMEQREETDVDVSASVTFSRSDVFLTVHHSIDFSNYQLSA